MRLASSVLLVCLFLLASPALAEKGPDWVEYGRSYAEVKSFKLLSEGPAGVDAVLARFRCMPNHEETDGCILALDIFRKLSLWILPLRVSYNRPKPPKGDLPQAHERITRYNIDCRHNRYAPVSTVWNDGEGDTLTRIEYHDPEWRSLNKIRDLAGKFCR